MMKALLLRMFGRPQGALGRLGGHIMARTNAELGVWTSGVLELAPTDRVLEIGFGPGVIVAHMSKLVPAGRVSGIDASPVMVEQARVRNSAAIRSGRVELKQGVAASLPFDDGAFDKVLAINSMQVWPDAMAGLREIRRVMKPGARIALGFTPYSGRSKAGLSETLAAAAFTDARTVDHAAKGFCVLATKPQDG
ncbi:class I SAM-dependent methyltransferase [Rhodoplanes sp. Z2-YC6860]|uniref:class I SAM-dependent methyltransferase n=1 Tax=Rhodoplanes sp. Z2-YC6860 TaxID=674703 RepID=UPI00078BA01C|nr:class I SAM-dependent methyltransferase [Rhodoplanes sp. Z2-YC6860]AMN42976.1 type 11 methyltransferase [Rhodoplanes sp. Z2-YC6860]